MGKRRTTNDGRRTTNDERRGLGFGRWPLIIGRCWLIVALGLLLSGCLMMSGEQTSSDALPDGGNLSTSFVSAEGGQERTIETGAGPTTLKVIVTVEVHQGELRFELLAPSGGVVLSVEGRPDEAVTKLGKVPTDSEGKLHYRIIARGARNGRYEVIYQQAEP